MGEDHEDSVKDAALISAAQRVEHYEMAAYGCGKTWAGLLGDSEAQALLNGTSSEEKETDQNSTSSPKRSTGRQMTDPLRNVHAAPALGGTDYALRAPTCHP
jgi:ferritin-like metal-binding protein YciE